MTPEFKQNVDIKTIKDMIENIDKIVDENHVDNETKLVDSNFNFARTLELEGYWLLPDGQFDFGDTSSDGTPLNDVSPLMPKPEFKKNLLTALQVILVELESN